MGCDHCGGGWVVWRDENPDGEVTYPRVPCSRCSDGLTAAGIGSRYWDADLSDFAPALARKVGSWQPVVPGWRIEGTVGTGKTHLASALVKSLLGRDIHAHLVYVPILLLTIRRLISPETRDEAAMTLRWIDRAQVLVLDDLGAERVTDFARDELNTLVDGRYVAERPVVITTNLGLDELSERLGDRIASRLAEMTQPLVLGGADRRLKVVAS